MRSSPSAWPASAVAGAADASDSTAATARGLVAEREKQQNFISVCYLQPKKKSGTDLFYTRSSAISSRHHPASAGAAGPRPASEEGKPELTKATRSPTVAAGIPEGFPLRSAVAGCRERR